MPNAVSILNQIVNACSRLCLRLIFSAKFQGGGVGVLPLWLIGGDSAQIRYKSKDFRSESLP